MRSVSVWYVTNGDKNYFPPTARTMAFLRQYVFPFLIVAMFLVALVAVSARIFLPADLAAPAPQVEAPAAEPVATQPSVTSPN
ncbi:hypothetical protein [Microseira sp. BLCC-F43]|jgi:hypothetical protein|uniref:hypothetical protein n=1 Tax=Microseira sp. BLCC-F43 TaxID=3153602 RepID=UPI0035BAA754